MNTFTKESHANIHLLYAPFTYTLPPPLDGVPSRLHSNFSAIGSRRATHWTVLRMLGVCVWMEECSNPSTTIQIEWREKCRMPIQFIVFINLHSPVSAWSNSTTGVCSNHENFKIYINNLLLKRKWCNTVNGTEWSARYLLPLHKCVVWHKKKKEIKRRRKHINTQIHTHSTPCTYELLASPDCAFVCMWLFRLIFPSTIVHNCENVASVSERNILSKSVWSDRWTEISTRTPKRRSIKIETQRFGWKNDFWKGPKPNRTKYVGK